MTNTRKIEILKSELKKSLRYVKMKKKLNETPDSDILQYIEEFKEQIKQLEALYN